MPTMLRTPVQSLVGEDPLEKGMATHSSIIAQIISWTETWQASVHGGLRVGHDLSDTFHSMPVVMVLGKVNCTGR